MESGLSLNQNSMNFLASLIQQEERQRVLIEVDKHIRGDANQLRFDNLVVGPLIEIIFDSLVDAINEDSVEKLVILEEAIQKMDQENYLVHLNLDYYRTDVPGNMQYLYAKELLDSLDRIFSASAHTFDTNFRITPSSSHPDFQANFCELLLLEAHGKSSSLGHQAVFIPQRLGGAMDVDFRERKYYSFKIEE